MSIVLQFALQFGFAVRLLKTLTRDHAFLEGISPVDEFLGDHGLEIPGGKTCGIACGAAR